MKKYISQNKFLLAFTLTVGAVYAVISTMMAFILREILDVATAGDLDGFFRMLAITVIYSIALALCCLSYSTLSKKFIGKVIAQLRADIFAGIFQKNIQDFKSVNSAEYLSALTNDVKIVEESYLIPLLMSLHNIVIFITAFVIMLYFSPIVTLCLIVSAALLFVAARLFKGKLQKRQDRFSKKLSRLAVVIKDFLSGFEVIRSYRMNSYVTSAFINENEDTYKTKLNLDKTTAAVDSVSAILGLAVQFSVFFVSAYLIITGKITAGMLLALVQVSGSVVAPIQILSQSIPKIQGTKPVVDRLKGFVDSKDLSFSGRGTPGFYKEIRVKDLRFGYGRLTVINGIDFTFAHNKKYAIIGKSGCGKSTLINLLCGNFAGYEGQIFYDGQDMRELDIEKLCEMSAVIHQNVYMFDESVNDNICLHNRISDEDLKFALDMSGVRMFLYGDKNLESLVGENGSNLSGGQRQRIAVARALVQKKPLLILDEGTSAVDMQTAYDIESRLLQLDSLTLITITHSLNPELLKSYDCIIFMGDGHIAESGTFEELVNLKSAFYDFYNIKS